MKKVEIQLKCDPEAALQIIRDKTDPPSGVRILRIMKDPWFWGRIEKNRIKIWPKGPNKDISSAYILGHIYEAPDGSFLSGEIINDPIFRLPLWLLAIAVLIGFPASGYLMYSFISQSDHFVGVFFITAVSIGILLIGIVQRTSDGQEEDLERFLRNIFKKSAISIEIA